MLIEAIKIIQDVLTYNNFNVIDVFEYGTRKIEIMGADKINILSISLVEDLSYDFTVFNYDGNVIIYNNSKRLLTIEELKKTLQKDLFDMK